MQYYKATRPDGTSFYDGTTEWRIGRVVKHPNPRLELGLCSAGVLHISDATGETLVGGSWPCRLFEVEPRGATIGPAAHKWGCGEVKVVRELPAWQALGPNGEAVAALIERCKTLTYDEAKQLSAAWAAVRAAAWGAARAAARDAAWAAARDAARAAARGAARGAVWGAAREAAWDAARDAVWALIVRDLISPELFEVLYGPWRSVIG